MPGRKSQILLGAAAAAVALLCGPVAVWLQARDWHVKAGVRPDVLYVVAGARHQDLRVDAASRWLRRAANPPRLLVGNDRTKGGWSTAAQRNLSMGEWAGVKLRRSLAVSAALSELPVDVVPGEFNGTDAEMAALAEFLSRSPGPRHVVVVTSAFHVRRTVSRLRGYLGNACAASAIAVEPGIEDYLPWVVLGECLKLGRDAMGLARLPFLSRSGWFDERDVWIAVIFLLLAYAWLLYPALLRLAAGRSKAVPAGGNVDGPTSAWHVTVLIAAHNEESHIARRIRNILDGQWPGDRLDVWVGSDGSTDATVREAGAVAQANPRVHVISYGERRGKTAVLRDLVAASAGTAGAGGDILVFTDANSEFDPGAVKALAGALDDPSVGGACGRLVFQRGPELTGGAGVEETGYWEWENLLKQCESRVDSCLGANGRMLNHAALRVFRHCRGFDRS